MGLPLDMENWVFNDIITFFLSLFIAAFIIPQILRVAFNKSLFDQVDNRKIHKGGIPRLGGISFFPAIILSFGIVVAFNLRFWEASTEGIYFQDIMPYCFLFCGVLLLYLVGIADDLRGVKYYGKFAAQILAGILIIFSGIYIDNFFGFLWIHHIYPWIGWILTVIMVVYVVNSMNLIDGIDGLASGLSVLAFIFYTIIFFFAEQYAYSMLACAGAGTLLPFFYFNVYGDVNRHTKIFMGDTGSLTIGLILVFCALEMLHLGDVPVAYDYNPVILGISPLLIPLFDAVRVFINRVSIGQNPFLPDKTHIHHRLLSLGFNQRVTLGILMVTAMCYIVINLLLSYYINPTYIIIADIFVWIIGNIVITSFIKKKELTHQEPKSR